MALIRELLNSHKKPHIKESQTETRARERAVASIVEIFMQPSSLEERPEQPNLMERKQADRLAH